MAMTDANDLLRRIKDSTVIFSEDECAPDAESLDAAWKRIFGEPRPKESIAFHDGGDCMSYEYPGGRFAQIGPPRCGWTEIRLAKSVARKYAEQGPALIAACEAAMRLEEFQYPDNTHIGLVADMIRAALAPFTNARDAGEE
jgi:hypothetical protein